MVMSKIGLQVREKSLNRWIFHGRNFGFSPEVLNPLEQKVSGEIFLMLGLFWPNILPKIYLTKQLVWQNMSWWCNLDFANIRQNAGRRTCWLVDISAKKGAAPMLKIMPPSSPATASLKPRHPLMFDFFFGKQRDLAKRKASERYVPSAFLSVQLWIASIVNLKFRDFLETTRCLDLLRSAKRTILLVLEKNHSDSAECCWIKGVNQTWHETTAGTSVAPRWYGWRHVQALLFLDLMASCSVEFLMAEIGYVVGGKHQLFGAVDHLQNWGTAFVWKAANESTHQEKAQLGKYMNMLRRYF